MKKLLFIMLLLPLTVLGQVGRLPYQTLRQSYRGDTLDVKLGTTNVEYKTSLNGFSLNKQLTIPYLSADSIYVNGKWYKSFIDAYPLRGIPISTGSGWGASIADNSGNWNAAYGWGDHSGLYKGIADSINLHGFATQYDLTQLTSSQWVTKGDNLYYNEGKVFIGKTSGTYDLDVNGLIGGSNIETNTISLTTKVGIDAGKNEDETTAIANTFYGYQSGYSNTTGNSNNFIGASAGYSNTTGYYNNFIGNNAGYSDTTGCYNNFIGNNAGYSNTTGDYNNFIGASAGYLNTAGYYNNFIGNNAGYLNTTGYYNNFIGNNAGYSNTTGNYNNFIGYNAGYSNTIGNNNNFIGNNAGYYETGSNKLYIDNQSGTDEANGRARAMIYGVFNSAPASQQLTFNSKVTVNGILNFGSDSGSADDYVITIDGISSYQIGMEIYFIANTANTGACTINVNSLGAKSLKMKHDQDPTDNYIESGSVVQAVYDGTNFQMLQPSAN